MPPKANKAIAKVATAPRLPPLPKLRVRNPNKPETNPCMGIMTSVLGCWASSGQAAQACIQLEQQLRTCMDAPRPGKAHANTINHHLGRMYPQIMGPHKRK